MSNALQSHHYIRDLPLVSAKQIEIKAAENTFADTEYLNVNSIVRKM